MPRASVSVRTVRSRRRGKKWSPVLVELAPSAASITANSTYYNRETICANSSTTTTAPTATVIKVGNIKVSFESESQSSALAALSGAIFLMFLPQGFTTNQDYPTQHPEYILAWRSFNPSGATSAVTIQSRLKRNLNSGDSIILFYKVRNDTANEHQVAIRAYVSYVCCNN